ncbi:solute carrier family 26 member 6 isoform X2 [Hyalella azteca]|uniref:Solute carrier family 26 member 6 isoform X2 n=1 Tax=Hyalella azteca TaxID=294128 RepID=A0A8B7NS00_HYAAZ|nr:solute carrier family 26 member 6 isoform X2 [Hyalella azteca]
MSSRGADGDLKDPSHDRRHRAPPVISGTCRDPSAGSTSKVRLRIDDDTSGTVATSADPAEVQQVHVQRPAYTLPQLRHDLCYQPSPKRGLKGSLKSCLRSSCRCSPGALWSLLQQRVPLLAWLPTYSPRRDLVGDLIAGLTVAVMHIPQGMAYAMLAEVPPILGLYTAFFPVLAYAIFGTSKHVSVGTFAVCSLMTGKVVGDLATPIFPAVTTVTSLLAQHLDNTTMPSSVLPNSGSAAILNSLRISARSLDKSSSLSDVSQAPVGFADAVNDTLLTGLSTMTTSGPESSSGPVQYTPLQVCVAVAFMVGVWQILFGLLHLGDMCVLLSDMLISGFTTGAAVHVLSSQLKHIFGLPVPRYSGPFRLIYTYIDLVKMLPSVNATALVMSVVCIAVLVFNNEIIKPRLRKITNFPVPIELIVVVVGTTVEYFVQFETTNELNVVGDIPTGLPEATLPDYNLFGLMLADTFVLAIVVFIISFSMVKIFSTKHGYRVDATQELYAGGISNIFGSMFSCVPSCVSLSRSLIQESVGGRTQMTSFVSCSAMFFVLLFIGPLFETLPNCVLASIIIVALKGMFLQMYDFISSWKRSKGDAMLWLVSFSVTVLVDIDYGLGCGLLFSLLVLFKRYFDPVVAKLGWVPNTDIYLELDNYQSVVSVAGASICKVTGALNFVNIECFKKRLVKVTGLDVEKVALAKSHRDQQLVTPTHRASEARGSQKPGTPVDDVGDISTGGRPGQTIPAPAENLTREVIKDAIVNVFHCNMSFSCQASQKNNDFTNGQENLAYLQDEQPQEQDMNMLVLCFSSVSWLDFTAAKQLENLFDTYSKAGITLVVAGANDQVLETLKISGLFARIPENRFFLSIHDALTFLAAASEQNSGRVPSAARIFAAASEQNSGHVPGAARSSTHDARPAVVALSPALPAAATTAGQSCQYSKADIP